MLVNSIRSYNIFKPTSIKRTLVNNINYKSKGIFPYVSVILPARNEQENIKKCLHSLLSQDYCNYEIIAVDDNSSDNTLSIMLEV
ncbi:MAG TPA: glycosyltransferase, partial [Nitrososphaeraceae archaeon]|nr:glycosyltransferase [Nitrososphaeraceae archaeon]